MMNYNYKSIQKWLILFIIVIFIGLASTISMIIYSTIDKGTRISDSLYLGSSEVMLLQNKDENLIKLDFIAVYTEGTETYKLTLLNKGGIPLETMNIEIEYSIEEDMIDYIYKPDTPLSKIYYYKIEKIQAN